MAPAVLTLHHLPFIQILPWDPANARCPIVCILWLNASQTTQHLISLLLPLGNQLSIRDALLQAPVIELAGDGGRLVLLIDVPRASVMDTKYWPGSLHHPLPLMRFYLGLPHASLKVPDGRFKKIPALGWCLSPKTWHKSAQVGRIFVDAPLALGDQDCFTNAVPQIPSLSPILTATVCAASISFQT